MILYCCSDCQRLTAPPTVRISDAAPSNTEPVPSAIPATVPQPVKSSIETTAATEKVVLRVMHRDPGLNAGT